MDAVKEYNRWLTSVNNSELLAELRSLSDKDIEERFYSNLEFGTGGLRGIIGVGTNRLNIYTVAKASQGLANYLLNNYDNPSVAISYDSRIKSKEFAEVAASIFSLNNINVHIYKDLMPTPCLSYAVRSLKCSAGVMITASHNPAKFNGYKVYNHDGCQITNNAANAILEEINVIDIFNDVKKFDDTTFSNSTLIHYIDDSVFESFINDVLSQSVLYGDNIDRNIKIVYSPLNGTGLVPIREALTKAGYSNIVMVKEQEKPDGYFPTCPFPNPEEKDALELGIKYARENNSELVMATDPDCDRVGIAVKNDNEYVLLNGNEVGVLLLDYICSQKKKHGKMPPKPYAAKTIVTTELATSVADSYGVKMMNVLTGFKYIGELAGTDTDNYVFGLEDSYGYLSGTYVRDKDAVNGATLIAEMFCYYKTRGISLIEKLNEIFNKFGYFKDSLYTFTFEGKEGMFKIISTMDRIRRNEIDFSPYQIRDKKDYSLGIDNLPKSNVIKFYFQNGSTFTIRPSGTEPKIKVYLSINSDTKEKALIVEKKLIDIFMNFIK